MGFVNAINTLNGNKVENVPAFWVNNPQIHEAAFQPVPAADAPAPDVDLPASNPEKTSRPKKAGPVKNSDASLAPDAATQESPDTGAQNSEE